MGDVRSQGHCWGSYQWQCEATGSPEDRALQHLDTLGVVLSSAFACVLRGLRPQGKCTSVGPILQAETE